MPNIVSGYDAINQLSILMSAGTDAEKQVLQGLFAWKMTGIDVAAATAGNAKAELPLTSVDVPAYKFSTSNASVAAAERGLVIVGGRVTCGGTGVTLNASDYATFVVSGYNSSGAGKTTLISLSTAATTIGTWRSAAMTPATSYPVVSYGCAISWEVTKTGSGVVVPAGTTMTLWGFYV